MPVIHFFTDEDTRDFSESDAVLARAFREHGVRVLSQPWETHVEPVEVGIMRSMWNYPRHLDRFTTWLMRPDHDEHVRLNSMSLARWNLDKRYLMELATRGVSVVPTLEVRDYTDAEWERIVEVFGTDIVMKPRFGSSGHGVMRIRSCEEFRQRSGACLVQPFVPALATGETSFIFIDGRYSHSVRRLPARGDFRANLAQGGRVESHLPTAGERSDAETVWASLPEMPFFGRVDGYTEEGRLIVSEVELLEPGLFFQFGGESATSRFVRGVLARL